MSSLAIRVDGLGKRYAIAHGEERAAYKTLRESLTKFALSPFRKRGNIEEFWALKDVSFEVKPGEVVGIIGRNGAGKSTLLKILSRITKPTAGHVEIRGRVGSLLEVGTGFHPELTGRENVFLNGSILGMSKREITRKFDEIVAFAEVEKFLDTPVKRYSSGMYVRLAFAVAAHLEPEILIVDEVLAVGDAEFQKKCLGKMSDFAHSGRTVLFVSHQMSAVQALCSHAVMMERGSVRSAGLKTKIIAEYIASSSQTSAVGEWLDLSKSKSAANARAWFTGLRYGSGELEAADNLYPEGPAVFDLRIESRAMVDPVYISVNLYDRFDTCLVRCENSRISIPLRLREGENRIRFRLDNLHLNPGTCRVELWMADGGDVLDVVPSAANVTVSDYRPEGAKWAVGDDSAVTSQFDARVVEA